MTESAEYRTWCKIKDRCYRQACKDYKNYGGRGITMCDRWRHSFKNFHADMGPRPSAAHTIERRDNNGAYSPDNCQWIPRKAQNRNKRNVRVLAHNGESKTLQEWGAALGLDWKLLDGRLRHGWSVERTLTAPVRHW